MFLDQTVALILFSSISVSYCTGEVWVKVYPDKYEIEPGSEMSFTCNSSLDISLFKWDTNDINETQRFERKLSNHSMELWLNTSNLAKITRNERHVLCYNKDHTTVLASSTIYFGYVPLAPKVECMLQNLDTIHCRWNHCDPRTQNNPEGSYPVKYEVSYHTTHYRATQNKHGNCSDDKINIRENCSKNSLSSGCYSSCAATEADSGWQYWDGLEIRLEAKNRIGKNISQIAFTPRKNVILSPPTLDVQNVTDGSEESADVVLTADFPFTGSDHFFLEYCEKEIVVDIVYKKLSDDINPAMLENDAEEEFWRDWSKHCLSKPTNDNALLDGVRLTIARTRQTIISRLQANETFLVQARWKHNGTSCRGIWSSVRHSTFRTRILKPPKFLEAAVLYFEDTFLSNINHESYDMNQTEIILWQHEKGSYDVYQSNEYCYKLHSADDKCLSPVTAPKSSNFIRGKSGIDCRMKLVAYNQVGNSSAPYFLSKPFSSECSPYILSLKKLRVRRKSIKFKIYWIFLSQNASVICNDTSVEKKINASFFLWEENCTECRKKVEVSKPPTNYDGTVRSFIAIFTSNTYNGSEHFPIKFQTKQLSSTMRFSCPVQPSIAYSIAAGLSFFDGKTVIQSPAYLMSGLYYHGVEKPKGIPRDIMCSNVDDSTMTLKWRSLPPQSRGGPILGYIIHVTEARRCLYQENVTACSSLYELCEPNKVRSENVSTTQISSNISGWSVENTSLENEVSHTITNLHSDTYHYVTIAPYNAAGIGSSFGCIKQSTKASRSTNIFLVAVLPISALVMLALIFFLFLRRTPKRRSVPRPAISVFMESEDINSNRSDDENSSKAHTYCEYVDLFDEMKPLNEIADNNNYPDKTFFCIKDASPCRHQNSIAPYLKNANLPTSAYDHGIDSSSMETACCSTGNESSPSSQCEYSVDGMSSDEEDMAIYTSTETALIIGRNRRRLF